MSDVVVTTAAGQLRGAELDRGIKAFKGVPYAAPPIGDRRFRPPAPVPAWSGVRDALELGDSCPQPPERPMGWSQEERESEDCLVLNVWTPATDGAKRPVMVWIHGGGFALGSGSWPLYDGANLAARGDVVVVTVNHRLGILGYLHLGHALGEEFESSGNNGMLDLVAALEWVRDNIEAFGGDPSNVTIFGESGGGAKVSYLMVMPGARGLFHRAAIQSGPGLRVGNKERAAKSTEKALAELGVDASDLRALWEVPVERLLEVQAATGRMGFSPVRDRATIPVHPGDALADGTAADVPVIVGSNRDEGTMQMGSLLSDPDRVTEDLLRERLAVYGDAADELLAVYRANRPEASRLDLLIAIQSDAFMRTGSIRLAEQKAKAGSSPVYMYWFCWGAGPLRSGHGYEIAYVFDNVGGSTLPASPERTELAHMMSDAWVAFARTGTPDHPGMPAWPAYVPPERPTMVFDTGTSEVIDDPNGVERAAWERLGLMGSRASRAARS